MKFINHSKAVKASINRLIEARNFLDELIELKEQLSKEEEQEKEPFDAEFVKKIFAGQKGSIYITTNTDSKEATK